MDQKIRIPHLFQCRFKRLHQTVRQPADESDSIDQNKFAPLLKRDLSMLRIQRRKEHILRRYSLVLSFRQLQQAVHDG